MAAGSPPSASGSPLCFAGGYLLGGWYHISVASKKGRNRVAKIVCVLRVAIPPFQGRGGQTPIFLFSKVSLRGRKGKGGQEHVKKLILPISARLIFNNLHG